MRNAKICGIAGVVCFLLFALTLTACGKKTYNLNEYYEYTVEGYDGYGEVSGSFDADGLYKNIKNDLKLSSEEKEELSEDISENIVPEWDKTENLSNGDTIELTWNAEKIQILNDYYKKINFTFDDIEDTISGLKEIPRADFFDGLTVSYDGIAPNGNAVVSGGKYPNLKFSIEPEHGLSNGDTIVVSIDNNKTDIDYLNEYSAVPETYSKSCTVEGLDSYLMSLDQLDSSTIDLINNSLNEDVSQKLANKKNGFKTYDREILGHILLTSTNDSVMSNSLYFVYKDTMDFSMKTLHGEETYHIIRYSFSQYKDVIVYSDGKVSIDINSYSQPEYTMGFGTGFTIDGINVAGYESYGKLYDDVVTANSSKYVSETDIDKALLNE